MFGPIHIVFTFLQLSRGQGVGEDSSMPSPSSGHPCWTPILPWLKSYTLHVLSSCLSLFINLICDPLSNNETLGAYTVYTYGAIECYGGDFLGGFFFIFSTFRVSLGKALPHQWPINVAFTRPVVVNQPIAWAVSPLHSWGHDLPCTTPTMADMSDTSISENVSPTKCILHLSSVRSKLLPFSGKSWAKFLSCARRWRKLEGTVECGIVCKAEACLGLD